MIALDPLGSIGSLNEAALSLDPKIAGPLKIKGFAEPTFASKFVDRAGRLLDKNRKSTVPFLVCSLSNVFWDRRAGSLFKYPDNQQR
jgi:hypothetical protein